MLDKDQANSEQDGAASAAQGQGNLSLSFGLNRPAAEQLHEQGYSALANILRALQPSHAEVGELVDATRVANIQSLESYLSGEAVEVCLEHALAEYGQFQAVISLQESISGLLKPHTDQEQAESLSQRLAARYLNVFIYHNAEHMLSVANHALQFGTEIAECLGTTEQERTRLLKRLYVSALYHDVGNGRFPREIVGVDESTAIDIFLSDFKNREEDSQLSYLADLSSEEVIQIAANIAGTVFRDRHSDRQILNEQSYIEGILSALQEAGFKVKQEDFVSLIDGIEATALKNADIASSIESQACIRNTFTNIYENCLKSAVFYGKTFSDSRRGFIALLRGKLQTAIHGRETDLSEAAQRGNLLINHDNLFPLYNQLNKDFWQVEREFSLTLAYDREVCDGMRRVIERNIQSRDCNILQLPMSKIADLLEAEIGSKSFAPYSKAFREGPLKDLCLVALTQEQCNSLFQLQSQPIIKAVEAGREDARPEVNLLADLYDGMPVEGWRSRYIAELLRFAHKNPKARIGKTYTLHPDENRALVKQGDTSTESFFLLRGDGCMVAKIDGQEVSRRRAPDLLGEISAIQGARTADLYVQDGSIEVLEIDDLIAEYIVRQEPLRTVLELASEHRLAVGQIVSKIDDDQTEAFLSKLFDFNVTISDPTISDQEQVALHREELIGIALERGWDQIYITPGSTIISEGQEPDNVYVIVDGDVHIQIGDSQIALRAGEMFGEMSLLSDSKQANADVLAGEKGVMVIALPRDLLASCDKALEALRKTRQAVE